MVVCALLLQQFKLELLDKSPQPVFGMGASRPEPTRLRYQRR